MNRYNIYNKKYGAKHFLKEFPGKGWTLSGLKYLLAKIDNMGSFRRQPGNGCPRTARSVDNVEKVESLVHSQEDRPQRHHTQRQIAREIGISQRFVNRIDNPLTPIGSPVTHMN